MTLDPSDIAALAAVVIAGPWGLVLAIALVRGYSIELRLRRPPPDQGDDEEEA